MAEAQRSHRVGFRVWDTRSKKFLMEVSRRCFWDFVGTVTCFTGVLLWKSIRQGYCRVLPGFPSSHGSSCTMRNSPPQCTHLALAKRIMLPGEKCSVCRWQWGHLVSCLSKLRLTSDMTQFQ
jgi:hypothetical protein